MNGVHDVGGMHGFGPVDRSETWPAQLERWEAASIALAALVWNDGNLDTFRHAIERMAPAHYLSSTYYEHWIDGVQRYFEESGEIDPAAFEARLAEYIAKPGDVADVPVTPGAPRSPGTRAAGHPFRRPGPKPRFKLGKMVLVRNLNPEGHTRLPRYLRNKAGRIAAVHGSFVFPDSHANGLGEEPQPLYSVCFQADEVWGLNIGWGETIYADLWESYLQPM